MAIFTPYSHSPEIQHAISPEDKRDKQVIPLALGYLSASVEAMQSIETTAYPETITRPHYTQEWFNQQPQPNSGDITALQDYYRKKAELAYAAHGQYDYPAEDITPEVRDFRTHAQTTSAANTARADQPIAPVVSFPDRVFDANPNLNNNVRRAA